MDGNKGAKPKDLLMEPPPKIETHSGHWGAAKARNTHISEAICAHARYRCSHST